MLAMATPAAVPGGPRPGPLRTLRQKIDQQRPDPGRTGLPGHTMPHGARPPGEEKAGCKSLPKSMTKHLGRLAASVNLRLFKDLPLAQRRAPDPGAGVRIRSRMLYWEPR